MRPQRTRADIIASQAEYRVALERRILACVKSTPLPSDAVARKIGAPSSTVREIMMGMMAAGVVHRKRDPNGTPCRSVRWYAGPGPEMTWKKGASTPSQSTVKVYPQDYPAREPVLAAFYGAGQSEQRV